MITNKIMHNVTLLKLFNLCAKFQIYRIIAIIYFSKIAGSYTLGMAVFSIVFISQAIFEIPTGIISDKFLHRKGSMVSGAILGFLSVLFYALANSYSFLIIGAILEGASSSFFSGTDNALLYESLKESKKDKDYNKHYGRISSMLQFSVFAAYLIGGIVVTLSYKLLFFLTLIPKFIQIIITLFIIEPQRTLPIKEENIFFHTKEAIKSINKNKKLKLLTITQSLANGFGNAGFQLESAFVRTIIPEWAIYSLKASISLLSAIGGWFSDKIIKKFGYFKLLVGSNIIVCIFNIVALVLQNLFTPILLSLSALTFVPSKTAKSYLMQQEFTNEQRATTSSIISLLGSISFSIISILIGYIADIYSPMYALIVAYVLPKCIIVPIYWKLFNGNK